MLHTQDIIRLQQDDLPVSPVKNCLIPTSICTDSLCKVHLCSHPSISIFFIELCSFQIQSFQRTQSYELSLPSYSLGKIRAKFRVNLLYWQNGLLIYISTTYLSILAEKVLQICSSSRGGKSTNPQISARTTPHTAWGTKKPNIKEHVNAAVQN